MKTILQEQRRSSVIVALITMVLGAVLLVWICGLENSC